uniref:Uncharacterized protein n=1 Tax=Trichobilharzia regenti TaxID=157069 RepID=A0AA85J4J1_TRIRE|nr:unnamed protein product [Trichobilharzia regenti]
MQGNKFVVLLIASLCVTANAYYQGHRVNGVQSVANEYLNELEPLVELSEDLEYQESVDPHQQTYGQWSSGQSEEQQQEELTMAGKKLCVCESEAPRVHLPVRYDNFAEESYNYDYQPTESSYGGAYYPVRKRHLA